MTWIVADMDDGVLRRAPTRRTGVTWALAHFGSLLLERHGYSGCWEYLFGFPDEDSGDSVFIVRADCLARNGWDLEQVPLFPLVDDPHEHVDREDDDVADVETVRTAS